MTIVKNRNTNKIGIRIQKLKNSSCSKKNFKKVKGNKFFINVQETVAVQRML